MAVSSQPAALPHLLAWAPQYSELGSQVNDGVSAGLQSPLQTRPGGTRIAETEEGPNIFYNLTP